MKLSMRQNSKKFVTWGVFVFLTALFIAAVGSQINKKWLYLDEITLIGNGYTYWHLNFSSAQDNPPFIQELLAVPLLFMNLEFPVDAEALAMGHDGARALSQALVFKNTVSHEKIATAARWVMVVLAVLLLFGIFYWGRKIFGDVGALFSVLLMLTCPPILVFSRMAQIDLGVTLFYFLSIYFYWEYLQKQTNGWLVCVGITTGLAIASKLSALVLLPTQGTIAFFFYAKEQRKDALIALIKIWLIAGAVMAVTYAVVGFPMIFRTLRWVGGSVVGYRKWATFFMGTNYYDNPAEVLPFYYGIIFFIVSNPIPFLLFLSLGTYTLIKNKTKVAIALLAGGGIYLLISIFSRLQIGLRIYLPAYPFLILIAAAGMSHLWNKKLSGKFFTVLLSVWLCWDIARVYPNLADYYNPILGGPEKTWKTIGLYDYSEHFKETFNFIRRHPDAEFIISFNLLNRDQENKLFLTQPYFTPDFLAFPIKANPVEKEKEYFLTTIHSLREPHPLWPNAFKYFKDKEPDFKIGYSVFIYDISQDIAAHEFLGTQYKFFSVRYPQYKVLSERQFKKVEYLRKKSAE